MPVGELGEREEVPVGELGEREEVPVGELGEGEEVPVGELGERDGEVPVVVIFVPKCTCDWGNDPTPTLTPPDSLSPGNTRHTCTML